MCMYYCTLYTELLTIGKDPGFLGDQFIFFIKQVT